MAATTATRFFFLFLWQGPSSGQQQLLRLLHSAPHAGHITMAIMARRPSMHPPIHPPMRPLLTEHITGHGCVAIIIAMGHGSPDTGDIETSANPESGGAGVIMPVPLPALFA